MDKEISEKEKEKDKGMVGRRELLSEWSKINEHNGEWGEEAEKKKRGRSKRKQNKQKDVGRNEIVKEEREKTDEANEEVKEGRRKGNR